MKKIVTIVCLIHILFLSHSRAQEDISVDTDGDGVHDLIEVLVESDPEDSDDVPFLSDYGGITCADINTGDYYRDCKMMSSIVKPTFFDFAKNASCEGFIKDRSEPTDYGFTKRAPRKEVGGIALKMRRVGVIDETSYSNTYRDVGKGESAWIEPMVETLRHYKIISSDRTLFRPDRPVFRAEAYAMIMKSVCMDTTGDASDWRQNIYAAAVENNLTSKETYTKFRANSEILRQELYVIATRAADWAERTGGCFPKPAECQQQ